MFSVYRLVDPAEPEHYRYVGKTKTKNLKRRFLEHIRGARNENTKITHKVNWIRSLFDGDLCPIMEVIEKVDTEEKAFEREKYYIKKYRAEGHDLTNLTDGGEGMSGWVPSIETRKNMSETMKGNKYALGIKHTIETRAKVSKARKGRKHSKETLEKMSKIKKNISTETRAKLSKALKGNKRALGYKHTEETCAKIGRASKGNKYGLGYKHSKETRTKRNKSIKEFWNRPGTREKMREAQNRPETRRKWLETHLKRLKEEYSQWA